MKHKLYSITVILLAVLFSGLVVAMAQGNTDASNTQVARSNTTTSQSIAAHAAYTYTTVITVTSGTDPNDSASQTCYTDPVGPPGPPTSPCTLRRAIVEASALGASSRPILIKFIHPSLLHKSLCPGYA